MHWQKDFGNISFIEQTSWPIPCGIPHVIISEKIYCKLLIICIALGKSCWGDLRLEVSSFILLSGIKPCAHEDDEYQRDFLKTVPDPASMNWHLPFRFFWSHQLYWRTFWEIGSHVSTMWAQLEARYKFHPPETPHNLSSTELVPDWNTLGNTVLFKPCAATLHWGQMQNNGLVVWSAAQPQMEYISISVWKKHKNSPRLMFLHWVAE